MEPAVGGLVQVNNQYNSDDEDDDDDYIPS